MNNYNVEVLADSIAPHGIRLTTLEVTFPRFILAEVNTHRMLSRNSASSRAIPVEKQIERVKNNPFVPETFNKRVKGMGVGDALDIEMQGFSRTIWLEARDDAIAAAHSLLKADVDKSRINRLLEPFMWHTAIITATDWDNFFALRDHPEAQPEFQIVARMMRQAMEKNTPKMLQYADWHLPLVVPNDREQYGFDEMSLAAASAGRCAKVSYDKHHITEPTEDAIARWAKLSSSGHWSPGEHPARALGTDTYVGNFRGWKQLRKFYANEAVFQG